MKPYTYQTQRCVNRRLPALLDRCGETFPAAPLMLDIIPSEPIDLRAITRDLDGQPWPFDALDGRWHEKDGEFPGFVSERVSLVRVRGGWRPLHPDWVRSLRDQCVAAEVPFVFDGWGDWIPISELGETDHLYRSNRKALPHEDQGALDESYGRTCTVTTGVVRYDGHWATDREGMAGLWQQADGHCSYQVFRLGRKKTGRRLDGREWQPKEETR